MNIEHELLTLFALAKDQENFDLCFRMLTALGKRHAAAITLDTLSDADIESLIDACAANATE